MRIVTEEAAPVTKLRKSVPAHVAAVLAQGLAKLPADRFASAAEFAAALGNPAFTGTTIHETVPAARAGGRRSMIGILAAMNAVLIAAVIWLAVRAPDGRVTVYDAGLPDSAPMGSGGYMVAFDVAPDGAFAVYSAHDFRLWYRDLRGLESHPLPGAAGTAPAIAPNGSQVAFFSDGQVKVTPVGGGPVTALSESPSGSMIRWLSDTELFVVEGDGARARWLDVGVGTVRTQDLGYCLFATPLPSGRFLCGGGGEKYARLLDTASMMMEELRVGSIPGDTTAPLLRGSDFRLLDDAYLTFVSIEGEIRVVPFEPTSHRVGRVATLQRGVRREAYSGTGQYRVMASGTLVYAPGPNTAIGRMVRTRQDGRLDSLPIEAAEFLRYDVAPDGRTLAAAVDGVQEQELRIYDLESGRRQVWLRGVEVGEPHWASANRLVVNLGGDVHADPVVVVGEPTASSPPDTVHRGTVLAPVSYGPGERIVGTGWESFSILALDLSVTPATLDTLVEGGLFGGLSPDGRWLSYTTFDFSETLLMPFPALGQRFAFPERVSEIQWLSPTEAVGWTCCTTWYRFEIREGAGNPIVSSRVWHRDDLHADTPGLSYTLSPDGELVYVRGPDTRGSHYLRVIPGWVERMKQVVAEANR
jgi:serine/threonine-protein kinase